MFGSSLFYSLATCGKNSFWNLQIHKEIPGSVGICKNLSFAEVSYQCLSTLLILLLLSSSK